VGAIIEELICRFNNVFAFIASTITETGDAVRDAIMVVVNVARDKLQELEKTILFGEFVDGDPPEPIMAGVHI